MLFAGTDPTQSIVPTSFKWNSINRPLDNPTKIKSADIDGDGKVDDIVISTGSGSICKLVVLRNTSTTDSISFASPTDVTTGNYSLFLLNFALADFNSDGKLDIVSVGLGQESVFINTSTPGHISFLPGISLPTLNLMPSEVFVGDYDNDGQQDIATRALQSVTGNIETHVLSIYRNTGINGIASFSRFDNNITGLKRNDEAFYSLIMDGDFDGDNKIDFIVRSAALNSIGILRNRSIPGTILFDSIMSASVPDADVLSVADMDNDGRPDIIARSRIDAKTLMLFKNVSSGSGNFAFTPQGTYKTLNDLLFVDIGELTGDGKVDIVTGYSKIIKVFKNISTANMFLVDSAFTTAITPAYNDYSQPVDISVVDIDGDGKNEINVADRGAVSIFRNQINESSKLQLCPPIGSSTLQSGLSGSSYQWKLDTGNGFVNIADNTNYTGTNTSSLQLNNIPSSWNGYKYACVSNSIWSKVFSLQFANRWIGLSGTAWDNPLNWSCGTVPDSNTDVVINSGTVVLNTNTTIRTLKLNAGVNLTVNAGFILTILH